MFFLLLYANPHRCLEEKSAFHECVCREEKRGKCPEINGSAHHLEAPFIHSLYSHLCSISSVPDMVLNDVVAMENKIEDNASFKKFVSVRLLRV